MKIFIAYGLIYSILGQQLQVDYVNNCGSNIPECLTYFDGCNTCTCEAGDTQSSACTEIACLVNETPYCQECEEDSYWLAYSSYQPPGTISCSLRFIRTAIFLSNNSRCGCPPDYPYYESGEGCINEAGCQRLDNGQNVRSRDKFRLRTPNQNRNCPYEYQLCSSNSDCPDYLACNIPENPYGSDCTPLAARFDNDCNLVTDCGRCRDDCMGEGIGYCEAPVCETTGCRSELCVPEGLNINTICIAPTCEESCLQYASCEADINGDCGWQGSTEYENCLAACNPPASEPTLPPICALVLCESEESRCASATCDGCNAADENIVCSVEDCDASPCCGCLTFRINGRNVTGECAGGQIACRCAQPTEDETFCCLGEQFSSICQRDCGTCYDVDNDCTAGPCDECPTNQLNSGDACNYSGTCYWGEETCCGQTFDSYGCDCDNGEAACFYTDACFVPPCSTTRSP